MLKARSRSASFADPPQLTVIAAWTASLIAHRSSFLPGAKTLECYEQVSADFSQGRQRQPRAAVKNLQHLDQNQPLRLGDVHAGAIQVTRPGVREDVRLTGGNGGKS